MGILTRSLVEKRETLANPSRWLVLAFGGGQQTAAGILINEAIALRSTTVMACIKIISETIAQLPLMIYKRLPNGGKSRITDTPLARLLHDQANSEMTSFELREVLQGHLLSWGNAYCEIERDNANRIIGLWPMLPDRTYPYRDPITGKIVFRTRIKRDPMSIAVDDTVTIQIPEEKVLHIKGLSFDGLKGYSVIGYARELVGEDLALQEFSNRFFGNGAIPGGVLTTDKRLTKEQHDRLKISWQDQHQGLTNAQRVAILEEGIKWQDIGIPLKDAQWMEARKFTRNMITSLFRIPPHMVGDVERSTSWGSGIEQQAIGFLVYTIQPWVVRWEQAMLRKLFTATEQQTLFPEFLVDGLVRGDIATRTAAYTAGRNGGWLSANEIREKENMNPVVGGDEYLAPLNMTTIQSIEGGVPGSGGKPQAALPAKTKTKTLADQSDTEPSAASLPIVIEMRLALIRAQKHVLVEAFDRCAVRERDRIQKGLEKRTVAQGAEFVRRFYSEHREYVARALLPTILGYAEALVSVASAESRAEVRPSSAFWTAVRGHADGAAGRYCDRALREAETGLDRIGAQDITSIANEEAVRLGNDLMLALYSDAGYSHRLLSAGGHELVVRQIALEHASAPTVVLMRHGQTDHNEEPQRYRGWKDVPLTEAGHRQSREVAQKIANEHIIDRIYSSDLRRATVGAQALREATGAPMESTQALRPWNVGSLAGQPVGDGSSLGHYVEHPNERVPGGESLNDFIDRYMSFVRPTLSRAAANGETVALVTHTRNIRGLLGFVSPPYGELSSEVFQDPDDPLDVGGYTALVWDGEKWVEQEMNNAPDQDNGAIAANALKTVTGPGSLSVPVPGWHPQQNSIDEKTLVAILSAMEERSERNIATVVQGLSAVAQAVAGRPIENKIEAPPPAQVNINEGAVQVTHHSHIDPGAVQVTHNAAPAGDMEISGPGGKMTIKRKG